MKHASDLMEKGYFFRKEKNFFFCQPDAVMDMVATWSIEMQTRMLAIYYDETTDMVCKKLREQKISFAICCTYSEDDLEEIFAGDWFFTTEQEKAVYTILIPQEDCLEETKRAVHAYTRRVRQEKLYQTIPLESTYDLF